MITIEVTPEELHDMRLAMLFRGDELKRVYRDNIDTLSVEQAANHQGRINRHRALYLKLVEISNDNNAP